MQSTTDIPQVNQTAEFNLERFFELSADLFCIAGYDGYFKKINRSVSRTLGFSNEELFSRPINSFVHPDDREITSLKRENIRKDTPLVNFENRYVTKNGEVVWLAWTSMPVKNEDLVFAIAKNITHKKKQEEDRNALLASLTTINHDLKQLTFTTSHDLRSPVTNLLSVFAMMDVGRIEDPETVEFIDMLKMATENLKQTLNTYVDALGQKNALNVAVEQVDLTDSFNTVLRSLSALIQSSGAEISTDFSAFAEVEFNRGYMDSVFLNLVTNAIKYARADHPPIISVTTRVHDGVKQLIFADEGLGFDMDKVRGKIFGLNQKFHHHGDSQGIGLYLVYNHITSLGGHIDVESKVNEGATFIISFRD